MSSTFIFGNLGGERGEQNGTNETVSTPHGGVLNAEGVARLTTVTPYLGTQSLVYTVRNCTSASSRRPPCPLSATLQGARCPGKVGGRRATATINRGCRY